MSGMLQSMEDCCTVFVRKVKFSRTARNDVVRYDSCDLGAEGLDGDWKKSVSWSFGMGNMGTNT